MNLDLEIKEAADQEAQQAAQAQPENQPQDAETPPETLEDAMFAEAEAAQAEDAAAEPPAEAQAEKPSETEAPQEPQQEAEADDLAEPEGLSEKASARFQALANQVKEYRAKDADYQQMAETVREFQTLAQESCNKAEEVTQLFDYAKAVKSGDFDRVEQYLKQQIMQFEAVSGRSLNVDLLSQFPDLQQRAEEMALDPTVAQELAQARWRQQQQQQYVQQQQAAQQAQWQQQQQAQAAEQQRQEAFNKAVQDVNALSQNYAKTDVLWPEYEPKVLEFAKTQLQQLPPEQWAFALQTFYNGLKQAGGAVKQRVPPLRGSMPAGGAAAPQSMEEAMFGSD